jgi:hypothetical protein
MSTCRRHINIVSKDETNQCSILASLRRQTLQNNLFRYKISRSELTNSPYRIGIGTTSTSSGITPRQLDMRRKVEILKYRNNNSSRQTKAQLFNKAVQRSTRSSEIQRYTMCDLIPRSLSAAGVPPGPTVNNSGTLYREENVPLYNYNSSYVSQVPIQAFQQNITDPYRFFAVENESGIIFEYNGTINTFIATNNKIKSIGILQIGGESSLERNYKISLTLKLNIFQNGTEIDIPTDNLGDILLGVNNANGIKLYFSEIEHDTSNLLIIPSNKNTIEISFNFSANIRYIFEITSEFSTLLPVPDYKDTSNITVVIDSLICNSVVEV